jgi:hypothetical protein
MTDVEQVISEIDELEDIYLKCKSIFPKIDESLIGHSSFPTAGYYRWRGYSVNVDIGAPITQQFIDEYAKAGNWINENAIIRLFGLLHYHGFVGKAEINKNISGWEHVRYCCWIRNVITKTKLNYEPDEESGNSKLRDEIIDFYRLNPAEYEEGEIPTPTNTVIQPMFVGCKNYVMERDKNV